MDAKSLVKDYNLWVKKFNKRQQKLYKDTFFLQIVLGAVLPVEQDTLTHFALPRFITVFSFTKSHYFPVFAHWNQFCRMFETIREVILWRWHSNFIYYVVDSGCSGREVDLCLIYDLPTFRILSWETWAFICGLTLPTDILNPSLQLVLLLTCVPPQDVNLWQMTSFVINARPMCTRGHSVLVSHRSGIFGHDVTLLGDHLLRGTGCRGEVASQPFMSSDTNTPSTQRISVRESAVSVVRIPYQRSLVLHEMPVILKLDQLRYSVISDRIDREGMFLMPKWC